MQSLTIVFVMWLESPHPKPRRYLSYHSLDGDERDSPRG